MSEENTPNVEQQAPPVEDKNVLRQELSKQGKAYQAQIAEQATRIAELEQVETDRKTAALKEANDFTALEATMKAAADEQSKKIAELEQKALTSKLDGLLRDKGITDEYRRAGMTAAFAGDQDAWLAMLEENGAFKEEPASMGMPASKTVAGGASSTSDQELWNNYQKSTGSVAAAYSKQMLEKAQNGTAGTWLLEKMDGSHTK